MKDLLSLLKIRKPESLNDIETMLADYYSKPEGFKFVDLILQYIEQNPDFYFGSPGYLVHFVEKYFRNGYEDLLIKSVKRKPTQHNLWMLNRIANGIEGVLLEEITNLFLSISTSSSVSDTVRNDAKMFYEEHA